MKTSVLLLCVLGALLFCSAFCSNANGPSGCCFKMYPRKMRVEKVQKYSLTDERCNRAGVVFLTKKNLSICVDPNMDWVQSVMKKLDENSL